MSKKYIMLKKIKKKLFRLDNIIFVLIFGFLLWNQFPVIKNNFSKSGIILKTQLPGEHRKILFFWSSTCAPCKLDMQRFKRSVENGKIKKEQILAINTYETPAQVAKFLKKNPYPFNFTHSPEVVHELGVRATPTLALVEGNKVEYISSGITFIGVLRAEFFVKK